MIAGTAGVGRIAALLNVTEAVETQVPILAVTV